MSRINGKRLWAIALALLMIGGASALAQQDILGGDQLVPEVINYKTESVRVGTFEKTVSIVAAEYYPLSYGVWLDFSGAHFVEYAVSRGATVQKGDVLARFTVSVSQAELARLELEFSRGQEETRRTLLEKDEAIVEARNAVAEAADPYEKEIRQLQLRRLELEREQYVARRAYTEEIQRENVEELRTRQETTELLAPTDGVVTQLTYKRVGDSIAQGEWLVELYAPDVVLLRVDNSSGNFRYNMPVTVTSGANRNQITLTGRVVASDSSLEEKRRSGHAFILLEDYDPETTKLRNPKVTGALIHLEEVEMVSRSSVTLENGKHYVTKLTDGMVQKRYVNTGPNNNSDIWILQGVAEGETLILD